MCPVHNAPTQRPVFGPEALPASSCPLLQPQPTGMEAVGAMERGAALHSAGWRALMGCPAHAMDVHSRLSHSLPSVAEGLHGFPDARSAALGCAFLPPLFASTSPVHFCACLFRQENAVIVKVIIKKWGLWSKRFELLRDAYKTMKC